MTAFLRPRSCLLLGAVLVLATGCRPADQNSAAPADPASSASSTPPASSQPASSDPASTSMPPNAAASSATPTPHPASSSVPAKAIEPGGCPTSALAIEALRASGAAGHQYAFLQFTNRSGRTCSLTGYPGVQLVKAGASLGQPAARSGKPVHTVQLAPGKSVTAQLVDASTCNAEVSDSVAIYPPNRTERVVVHLSVRGCPLTIDPVVAS